MEGEQSDVGHFEMEKPLLGMIRANLTTTRSRLRERERQRERESESDKSKSVTIASFFWIVVR